MRCLVIEVPQGCRTPLRAERVDATARVTPNAVLAACQKRRGPCSCKGRDAFGTSVFSTLLEGALCITMRDMKTSALTIRLDPALQRQLARIAKRTGRSRSEVVRDAVRRQLALTEFDELRRQIMPFAEARGYLTDDDIFRDVS